MAIICIKDSLTDDQARVIDGVLQTSGGGGGGGGDVNIFDSSGNPINSTGGALNVLSGGGWTSFGQSTPKTVTVSDVSTLVLDTNTDRLYASFTNNSLQLVYLQYGIAAEWQRGQPIPQNSTWEINTSSLFQGQVYAITESGSVQIDVKEGVSWNGKNCKLV